MDLRLCLLAGVLLAGTGSGLAGDAAPRRPVREPRDPPAGLLYYAKADFASAENRDVVANPAIRGAVFQVVWSRVAPAPDVVDWSELDGWMAPWRAAGKVVAVRFLWSTSGYWPRPEYKTPTPAWVWAKGARFAFHEESGTEIPLIWDPIYREYACRLLEQFAARYDADPAVLFVDVTPGAETNPYRFGTIARRTPDFAARFEQIPASDGRTYSEALWAETVKGWIDDADRIFARSPLLVTLNRGGLHGPSRLREFGDYCVERGFYVGQNGLAGRSYGKPEESSFHAWGSRTRLFFEMVAGAGGRTGSLMEVMEAADRIGCDYLNVYPRDVRRGTRGDPEFDPVFEEALIRGARSRGAVMPAPAQADPGHP